jgi:hypothetical protein
MPAVANNKWDALPGIIDLGTLGTYNAETKTIVGETVSDLQTLGNIFIEGAQIALKKGVYIESATAKAGLVDLLVLLHIYPQGITMLPIPSAEVRDARKMALESVQ